MLESRPRSVALLFLAVLIGPAVQAQQTPAAAPLPSAAQGVMVGEVTPESAHVQVRLTAEDQLREGDVRGLPGHVEFVLRRAWDGKQIAAVRKATVAAHDFVARATFDSLEPGQQYRCQTRLFAAGGERLGPVASFRTLYGPHVAGDVRFVVVTGMNYAKFHGDGRIDRAIHRAHNNIDLPSPYAGLDKQLGYPALETIRQLQPDFFVGTGDNVYYDTPREPRARTITEMRRKWHEQFAQPRYRSLFAVVPTYWMMDDHDFRIDDADNSGDYLPTPELGRRVFLEQLPIGGQADADANTYRTLRVSRDLQIWFPENRLYRSDNKLPDGPQKTIWGPAQRTWLQDTLRQSDATFKLLVSPTPMVGPDDKRKTDNHTNIGGFQHERDAFFSWLHEAQLDRGNFAVVCGDRHWQYHARHPSGIEEFSCGALVDANSRLGRKPGDPASTDPQAEIQQLYTQDEPSGGFLEVQLEHHPTPRLTFVWRDERGSVLHTHQRSAAD